MSRDTWLYGNGSDDRIVEAVRKSADALMADYKPSGRTELNTPASDVNFRMLTGAYKTAGPRITNWGGSDNDSLAVSVQKGAPDYPPTRQLKDPFEGLYSQGIALEPPLPPDRLLNLTEENTLHSGCLMAKAFDACGRGWGFDPKDGKKAAKALMKSELPEKLKDGMELLTPDMTFGEMLYQAAWEMDAIGWSTWEVVRIPEMFKPGAYYDIGAIYAVPAFTIRATIDSRRWVQIRAGRVRFFKKFGAKCEVNAETGQIYDWKNPADMSALAGMDPESLASELIVFKAYTPRSLWYGIPRWISSVPTIAELTAIREFNVSWFASGGQTDYIVSFTSPSIEVAKKMRDDARQQMQENQGRGHTNILVAGDENSKVEAQKLGELLREGHFRFRRSDLAKEILIAHNVPPYRIGWAETGSGSGLAGNPATEMMSAYKFGAIQPIQAIIEDRLKCTLFDEEMGISTGVYRFKLAELQLDDVEKELDSIIKKVDNAIMTPNEAREELGMEPVKDEPELGPMGLPGNKPAAPGENPFEKPGSGNPFEQGAPAAGAPDTGNPFAQDGTDPYADDLDPYAEPKDKKNPFAKAEGENPFVAGPNADEQDQDPAAPGDPAAPKPPFGGKGPMPEKKPNQAEAMNKFYYKGKELGTPEPAPGGMPQIGPDGKPMAPKPPFGGEPKENPFAPKESPDGAPAPGPGEQSVDKSTQYDMIKEFGNALRESLQGSAAVKATDSLPPSESRPSPSRSSRRQIKSQEQTAPEGETTT